MSSGKAEGVAKTLSFFLVCLVSLVCLVRMYVYMYICMCVCMCVCMLLISTESVTTRTTFVCFADQVAIPVVHCIYVPDNTQVNEPKCNASPRPEPELLLCKDVC